MTSLEQKVLLRELQADLAALAQRVAELESSRVAVASVEIKRDSAGRGLCPKCGVKPNHHFHVKHCDGDKKNKNDADERTGNQGGT